MRVDQVGDRLVQSRDGEVPVRGQRQLVPARPGDVPGGLVKCIYMALMSLDPTSKGRKRWTMRWKAPLNAFHRVRGPAHPGQQLNLNNQDQPLN
nr:hypothetical protein [Streptomyces coffeae]